MKNIFLVRKDFMSRIFMVPRLGARDNMLIDKRTVARWLFYFGILIAYYGTLNPWFLWSISRYVHYLAAVPIALSMMFSKNLKEGIFNRKDFMLPIASCILLQLVMAITSGKNANGVIVLAFSSVVYLGIFKIDRNELRKTGDMLALSMACILAISIPFYLLHLAGFNLPHSHIVPADWDYSFENYRFFLVDDRFSMELLSRFHSVFLEPSHLGMACIALLYAQIGKWKTLRCKIIFAGLLLSFSLAAYLCLVVLVFSSAWMKGKAVMGKIILLVSFVATIIVGSMFYNKGQNIVNILIVQRLGTNAEGKFEGDNRTDEVFTREYEKMASSEQIFLGKGMEAMERFGSSGNSGYRVYLYTYGLVSVLFLLVFFFFLFRTSDNMRAKVAMSIISLLSFVAHGIPIKYYFFIPLYILLFSEVLPNASQKKKKRLLRII